MKYSVSLMLGWILSATTALAADTNTTVTFDVQNMTCVTCPIAVRKAMQRVEGVRTIEVNLDQGSAVVIFDPSVTTASEIAQASTNVGFPTTARDDE